MTIINEELKQEIADLKCYTFDAIKEKQESHCPVLNVIDFKNVWRFRYNGYYTNLSHDDTHYYESTNMKYEFFKTTKPKTTSMADTILNLVSRQIIFPLLVFVNGKFRKWTDLSLISDINNSTYLIVENIPDHKWDIQTVYIPSNKVLYMEEPTLAETKDIVNASEFYMMFDADGLYTTDRTLCATIFGLMEYQDIAFTDDITIEQGMLYVNGSTKDDKDITRFINPLSESCFIGFDLEGKFISDLNNNLNYMGLTTYEITNMDSYFTSNPYNFQKVFSFFWTGSNSLKTNYDMVRYDGDEQATPFRYRSLTGQKLKHFNLHPGWLQQNYETNVREALTNILSYDQSLLNGAYLRKSMIQEKNYTVKEFLNTYSNGKTTTCHIPMNNNDYLNNGLLLFVDGLLYGSHSSIQYKPNEFILSMAKYKTKLDSAVDMLFLNNIENSIYNVTINNSSQVVYVPEDISIENLRLFYQLGSDYSAHFYTEYKITPNDYTYLPVDFTYTQVSPNGYTIHFTDAGLYGQSFKMVSKRQFIHQQEIWSFDEYDFHLPLNDNFNYAVDDYAFLVFINGYKLPNDAYIVTLPKVTRPFTRPILEITTNLEKGDIIDVFYLPQSTKSISANNTQGPIMNIHSGNFDISQTKMYNLSKQLEFFFINGRKVTKPDLIDITYNQVAIKVSKAKSFVTDMVDVLFHIDPFDLVTEIYESLVSKKEYLVEIGIALAGTDFESNPDAIINYLSKKSMGEGTYLTEKYPVDVPLSEYTHEIQALINNIILEYYADAITTSTGTKDTSYTNEFVFDVGAQYLTQQADGANVVYLTMDDGMLNYALSSQEVDTPTLYKHSKVGVDKTIITS